MIKITFSQSNLLDHSIIQSSQQFFLAHHHHHNQYHLSNQYIWLHELEPSNASTTLPPEVDNLHPLINGTKRATFRPCTPFPDTLMQLPAIEDYFINFNYDPFYKIPHSISNIGIGFTTNGKCSFYTSIQASLWAYEHMLHNKKKSLMIIVQHFPTRKLFYPLQDLWFSRWEVDDVENGIYDFNQILTSNIGML